MDFVFLFSFFETKTKQNKQWKKDFVIHFLFLFFSRLSDFSWSDNSFQTQRPSYPLSLYSEQFSGVRLSTPLSLHPPCAS